MATSALLGNPLLHAAAYKQLPCPQRASRSVLVRCQGQDKIPETKTSQGPSATLNKVSTKFTDLFAFSGPAPERINGRLAMVGFVSAIGVELANGDGLISQLGNGGLAWFLYTSVLLSAASLVPLFRGENPQTKTDGIMTSDAELWNGRFAMLGLVALALTEYVKGGALV